MTTLPIVMTAAGALPQSPDALRAQLLALATAASPGLTANLPAALIEDISSTDVAALAVCDSAFVDLINSITPYGSNEFLTIQLGNQTGVPRGTDSNTSVYVIFHGAPGFLIAKGFVIGDGTHSYTVSDGGIIQTDGNTLPLFCLATTAGIWAVPQNTVTLLQTSIPTEVGTVTVNNPNPGTPGGAPETIEAYRARVVEAEQSIAQGVPQYLKKQLKKVPGVQARLVSMRQHSGGGWEVICGGGDPYQVAYAIFMGLFDISTLVGSSIDAGRNISVTINDYPDTYGIIFVNPPQQTVAISLLWNTTSLNFVSDSAIQALGAPALVAYVNNLAAGQPMNLFELQDAFKDAVATAIPPALLTRMAFTVSINTVVTAPATGTGVIAGDPESYFFTALTSITIARG